MAGLPQKVDAEAPSYSLYEGIEYQDFWDSSQRRLLDELEHTIVRDLLSSPGHRIIDVGCGYGRLSDCYMGRFQQVIMLDGSVSLLRQAIVNTGGNAIYIAADATHLPFRTASFDAVLMIRVFHHIPESRTCLSELHRILCNDGRFVFSYRNKRNMLRVIQWLIGKEPENPFTQAPVGLGTTLISHHPKAIHQMLDELGFSHIRYHGAGVMDWLAGKIGFAGSLDNLGMYLAPFFGRTRTAPWMLCAANARRNNRLIDARGILDLLQCPACCGDLSGEPKGYLCSTCQRFYHVEDGIIDLRI